MHTTPHSLLDKLRQSPATEAWQRFVHLYTPVLFNWASRAGLQESDAADLVQEVFLILVKELPRFQYDRTRSFHAWLRTVTMNKLRDWRRRAARVPVVTNNEHQFAELEGRADSYWVLDHRRDLTRRALELMRTDFEPTTWQACWEFLTTGKSAVEVANQFGISENAVYIAKCRVVRRLRQELRGLLD
jgi:RNA polymerase sigma-70 factor (ECF subfamily)